jgi:hypothetical protein
VMRLHREEARIKPARPHRRSGRASRGSAVCRAASCPAGR